MPKKPIDYKKSVIYSITSKTDETLLYIGSTTDFRRRKTRHKSVCNNENDRDYNLKVYVMIRANGGWDAFEMKPVKEYSCENKIQLTIEEERIRKEMNAKLNSQRAYTTIVEKKEYINEYYQQHKDERKEYREQKKEMIFEKKKKYREQNKEKKSRKEETILSTK